VDPKQGSGFLPFLEDIACKKPLRRSIVLEIRCGVVICGRIRGGLPFSKVLSHFLACDSVRRMTASEDRTDDERCALIDISFASVAASLPSGRSNISNGVGD
jgi:hypothetical protein